MDTGFFKWVWRFNALAISCAATLLLGLVLWEMTSTLRNSLFQTYTTNTLIASPDAANTEADAQQPDPAGQRRYLDAPLTHWAGSPYALPLRLEQEYANRGISESSFGNVINYRILDTETQTSWWLFPAAKRLIINTRPVTLPSRGKPDQRLGTVLSIVEQDTNDDQRLSEHDTMSLYLVDPAWLEPLKITQGVIATLEIHPVNAREIDLIFETADGIHAARIDATTGVILSEQIVTAQQ